MCRFGRLAALIVVALSIVARAGEPYRGGVIASPSADANRAAVEILNRGGNAVDAAVAAAFVIAVTDSFNSGLGGGGFAVIWDAKAKKARALDFRETAPAAATRDMFLDAQGNPVPSRSTDLGPSIAVPGAVAGYLELLRSAGRLPPKVVMAPAIRIARQGSWATPRYVTRAEKRVDCLRQDPDASRIFLRPGPDGAPAAPKAGTALPQPELAKTLEEIAGRGERAFYAGRIAQAMVDSAHRTGGLLSLADLAGYKPLWREPLEGRYRGHRLLTMPPPSAGGVAVLQTLSALERHFPDKVPFREPPAIHFFVEVLRRVYADRNRYLGDPAFVHLDVPALVSPDYVAKLIQGIDPARATPSSAILPAPAGSGSESPGAFEERKQTSHLSAIDKDGNAVALTTTINYYFGSCVVAKGAGFLLNDEMDDFTAKPFAPNLYGLAMGEANAVAPGKRPASSMSPALVFQKDRPDAIFMAVGSPGGSTIPTTVIQTVSNVIDHGMNLSRAVGWGRVHHQYLPDAIWVDPGGLEPSTQRALEAMGHKLRATESWGDAEAVLVDPDTGLRSGASDPRNEGNPAGQE